MFEKFIREGAFTPYMMALCRARVDIQAGVLSVKEASELYSVDVETIEQFSNEIAEYDKINQRGSYYGRVPD